MLLCALCSSGGRPHATLSASRREGDERRRRQADSRDHDSSSQSHTIRHHEGSFSSAAAWTFRILRIIHFRFKSSVILEEISGFSTLGTLRPRIQSGASGERKSLACLEKGFPALAQVTYLPLRPWRLGRSLGRTWVLPSDCASWISDLQNHDRSYQLVRDPRRE